MIKKELRKRILSIKGIKELNMNIHEYTVKKKKKLRPTSKTKLNSHLIISFFSMLCFVCVFVFSILYFLCVNFISL